MRRRITNKLTTTLTTTTTITTTIARHVDNDRYRDYDSLEYRSRPDQRGHHDGTAPATATYDSGSWEMSGGWVVLNQKASKIHFLFLLIGALVQDEVEIT